MKERGILFTPENYAKCADGSKTQTRRIMKPQPCGFGPIGGLQFERSSGVYDCKGGKPLFDMCPYGTVGDRLYVKEGLEKYPQGIGYGIRYRRDKYPVRAMHHHWGWQKDYLSPLHMPKWAARLWLELTDVRVERLQEITEADAIAEGCPSDLRRETWWQGYRSDMTDCDGNLLHWQAPRCDAPPPTMLDPKQMTVMSGNTAIYNYRVLWHQIHGPLSWDLNPWLWCLTFRK